MSLHPHPPSAAAHADHHLDAAHEQIQRQLQAQRAMQPHPPASGSAAAASGGRAQRHSGGLPRPVTAPSNDANAAAAAASASPYPAAPAPSLPPQPLPQESLPYHRKRLLELVDPATYEAVLADTASQQLGFDLASHPDRRWVVEALFLAPLPQGVVRCYDAMGRAYYFDHSTQSSSWAHPCAKQFEALLQTQTQAPLKPAAQSTASSLPATPKRRPHRPDTEEKTNTDDVDDSGSDDDAEEDESETTTTTAASSPSKPAQRHSKSFLRSNAGLSSTSSLFLTEEELAHWNDGDPPLPPPPANRRGGPAARGGRRTAKAAPWINDELGGRDGERWAGEDGEPESPDAEQARLEQQKEAHASAARIRASSAARARVRASRPSSAYPSAAASASSSASASAARSWNSAQPQPFHPWANARGTGDTEHTVPHPGSLIAPAPFAPAATATAGRSSLHFARPSSGVQSRPTSAFHGSSASVDAAFRAQQSQQIREGHKITRARINGSLRSKASHLYTLRATLLTKLRALSRLHDGSLTADEKSWRDLGGDVHAFTAVNDQRTHLFRQAFPMLDAEDARALGRMLHRSSQELEAASARVSQALLESSALKAQVLGLQQDLQREVENASESLRIDAQCLEIARTGLAGDAASTVGSLAHTLNTGGHAPSTSLPRIHELLDLVLHFQNHARTHGAKLGARLVSEKKLLAELTRANQIVLRRGAQHASERREQIVAACLANKATIPGLTAQVKELQSSLQAQIEPLTVCQRTYELRRNESSLDSASSSSVHLRDENLDLLHRLEDELAALTTLVAHLESELSLTQSTLSSSLDRDRTLKAEASTEEVRGKFYRSALAVQPGPSYVPLIRRGSTQNQTPQPQPPQSQHPDRPRSREASPSRLGASFAEHQQSIQPFAQSQQWSAAPPPHPHSQSQSRPASSHPTRPSSSQSLRIHRPASATSTAPLAASELLHERNQLVRDQAANLERLRTRKVRRAKIAQGAASKQELLIPNAGRPVFEGGNDGYES